MSSWVNKSRSFQVKPATIPQYLNPEFKNGFFQDILTFLGGYIYTQRLGERLYVYDRLNLFSQMFRKNPQIQFLKSEPENTPVFGAPAFQGIISSLRFPDIQKQAGSVYVYADDFNQSIINILQRNNIKSLFDIGLHVVPDPSGNFFDYVNAVRAYQTKYKKTTVNLFIACANLNVAKAFEKVADSSWRITHLHKTPIQNADEAFLRQMAEAQVLSTQPGLVLCYQFPFDRYVYLMHRNPRGLEYLNIVDSANWYLV